MGQAGLEYLAGLRGWTGEGDFSLSPLRAVAHALGDPQDSFRSIHVAGTNGKGSVCAIVSSILGATGCKVGLTTSPHLVSLTERVIIDGLSVSEHMLSAAAEQICKVSKTLQIQLTHFEAITLCAFIIFREQRVDFAVVEVGLGGRLDASNIISKPDITAIVSISEDHQDILGSTLSEIATEKAGIIKPGVPCIVGELHSEAFQAVRAVAMNERSELQVLGVDFKCNSIEQRLTSATYDYFDARVGLKFEAGLVGDHQANNIAVAIAICRRLLPSLHSEVVEGMKNVYWPGRLELIDDRLLFDCAHNQAGIMSLIRYLSKENLKFDTIVFGALKSKNWQEMLLSLGKIKQWFIVEPCSPQSLSCSELEAFISKHELGEVVSFGSDYLRLAQRLTYSNEKVLVTGSIYMIGELRKALGTPSRALWFRNPMVGPSSSFAKATTDKPAVR